jgi:hypothetical protein
MAETLDMTLDDIIKNNKKSKSSSGGGRRSRGGSAPGGGGGSGSGGVGPTRRPFKRAGNRQAPYQPPKVRTNRTGCCAPRRPAEDAGASDFADSGERRWSGGFLTVV